MKAIYGRVEVRAKCRNCGACSVLELEDGDDPICRGCGEHLFHKPFDPSGLEANAELLPEEEWLNPPRRCRNCGRICSHVPVNLPSDVKWVFAALLVIGLLLTVFLKAGSVIWAVAMVADVIFLLLAVNTFLGLLFGREGEQCTNCGHRS